MAAQRVRLARSVLWVIVALTADPADLVRAGDWPQILGPARNGVAVDEKIVDRFPAGGPPKVWEAAVGSGFAGVAVADGKVILFHRQKGEEIVAAFAANTGAPLWKRGFPCDFQAQIVNDDGPRCVPTVQGGAVYAFGPSGGLHCVDLQTGAVRWSRQTHREFQAPAGYFGAGSCPLLAGDKLIVNVGGPKGAGVVAFDAQTGKTVWQKTDEQASYAAPVLANVAGKQRVLMITRLNFVGFDPATGEEAFRTPFGMRGPTVNGALPVVMGSRVLLTASYGIGAKLIDLSGGRAAVAWEDELLSSQYTTPIVHEGLVYGIDGRQDGGLVALKCFDPTTRKVLWTKSDLPYATLVAADGKLLVMHTDGTLRLVALSRDGYRELGVAELSSGTTRALPALAHGLWYVRDERILKCVSLRPAQ